MHRDLKAACAKPSSFDLKAQQRSLNRFIKEYNHIRPHESLGMKLPQIVMTFQTDHTLRKTKIGLPINHESNEGMPKWSHALEVIVLGIFN